MSDLVITSRPVLKRILSDVEPFVVFKRKQVERALEILQQIRRGLNPREFLELARHVDAFSSLNHSKTKRIFAADVERHLYGTGVLAPVTTSSESLPEEMEFPAVQRSIYELHNTPTP
jgi:hypothetical protein